MNQNVYDGILAVLTAASFPADSSEELAYHIALHFPEQGAVLLGNIEHE